MKLIKSIYVAGSFLEKGRVRNVENILRAAGYEITSTWVNHAGIEDPKELEEQALVDEKGIRRADALVVVLPGRYSTASEIGLAIGLDEPVFLLGEKDPQRNLFFYHPLVTSYFDIDYLIEELQAINEKAILSNTTTLSNTATGHYYDCSIGRTGQCDCGFRG